MKTFKQWLKVQGWKPTFMNKDRTSVLINPKTKDLFK